MEKTVTFGEQIRAYAPELSILVRSGISQHIPALGIFASCTGARHPQFFPGVCTQTFPDRNNWHFSRSLFSFCQCCQTSSLLQVAPHVHIPDLLIYSLTFYEIGVSWSLYIRVQSSAKLVDCTTHIFLLQHQACGLNS